MAKKMMKKGSSFYGGGSYGPSSYYGGGGRSGGGFSGYNRRGMSDEQKLDEEFKDISEAFDSIEQDLSNISSSIGIISRISRKSGTSMESGQMGSILGRMEEAQKKLKRMIKNYKRFD